MKEIKSHLKMGFLTQEVVDSLFKKIEIAEKGLEFYANLPLLDYGKDVVWVPDAGTVVPKGGRVAKETLEALKG